MKTDENLLLHSQTHNLPNPSPTEYCVIPGDLPHWSRFLLAFHSLAPYAVVVVVSYEFPVESESGVFLVVRSEPSLDLAWDFYGVC